MDVELSLEFVRVVEEAAIAAARTMGRGDRHLADQAAVEAMRRVLDTLPVSATVVIGEGERDEAPMLFIGEKVGPAAGAAREVDWPWTRSKGQTFARRARPGRLPRLPLPSAAGCSMPPTVTWTRLW